MLQLFKIKEDRIKVIDKLMLLLTCIVVPMGTHMGGKGEDMSPTGAGKPYQKTV